MKNIQKIFIFVVLLFMLFGCSAKNSDILGEKSKLQKEIEAFSDKTVVKPSIPPAPSIVLPPAYKKPSPFIGKTITFSSVDSPLSTLLYALAKEAGLNLVVDKDVDLHTSVTLNLNKAPLKEALDIAMDISGCYYTIEGNILHIKLTMRKVFQLPYIHPSSSFASNLGGDIFGASKEASNLSGEFSLAYDNPKEMNDFYKQIEENIKSLLSENGVMSLNKFSGVLSVVDKRKNIQNIEKFINRIKTNVSRQVLIEAKIMEVILNDSNQLGIDWQGVFDNLKELDTTSTITLAQPLGLSSETSVAGRIGYSDKKLSITIQALKESGKVETLANPRIKVLSGQSAIISSGKIVPFWEKEVTQDSEAGTSEVTYNRRDVLDGISLGVTPIVKQDGSIILNIIPISTTIEEIVEHTDGGAIVASAPILNIKESGTVIEANDNDMVIIGGLISDSKKRTNKRVPGFGDIKGVGALFQNNTKSFERRELVILLKLKIVQK